MMAGFSRIDITPGGPVWLDGMIRAQKSTGVHDPIFAKSLVFSGGPAPANGCVLCSLDVCGLSTADGLEVRAAIRKRTGIPEDRILIAATHNHSGPATLGIFGGREDGYLRELKGKVLESVAAAISAGRPATVGIASGREETVSHYRRLLADDGHVVMNWEPWPAERLVGPLGVVDPEVGVIKVVADDASGQLLGVLFNHAGHPNVMSGENLWITPDYPGRAEGLVEMELGGTALFVNGAQGTMDIDGSKDRDWQGVERAGRALAEAVVATVRRTVPSVRSGWRSASRRYAIPSRRISEEEAVWAESVLKKTGGAIRPAADGIGDDYLALLLRRLAKTGPRPIPLEQTCLAMDDGALLSFPGELFTEIGLYIKAHSPFPHTYILGLTNGYVGYVPTRRAVKEGGYEAATRELDERAEEVIIEESLALLRQLAP